MSGAGRRRAPAAEPADPVAMEEVHEQPEEQLPARHDNINGAAGNMLKGQTPIFTPVTPPQLNSSTDYKCVTEFLTKYKKYAALIEDRRNRHSQDIYPEAMKNCMPDRILNSIAKFRIPKPVQNITGDDIKGYLVKIQREALCEDNPLNASNSMKIVAERKYIRIHRCEAWAN
ncbi:Uncharacterized protein PBTT_06365 [Plasmodiophora brassicae]